MVKYIKVFLYHIREKKEKEKQDVKQDKDIKDREGTQPAKYYDQKMIEGDDMAKSTKQVRARHFAKYGKKDDDDDSNYKPDHQVMLIEKLNLLNIQRNLNRCLVNLRMRVYGINIHKKRQRIKRGSGERMRKW